MVREYFLENKGFLIWAISAAILTAVFAIAPQIDLWLTRGNEWKGVYAVTDYDEPFYGAYLQSLVEGKPRLNSPYTGASDSPGTPQKESYLSIQFLASYPTALIAKIFRTSFSSTMILLCLIIGFMSALILFWLMYIFSPDALSAFVGTMVVMFGGALAAGQGNFYHIITNEEVHYSNSLIFLRRTLPATAFPFFLLLFVFIWKLISAQTCKDKFLWGLLSIGCFIFNIFSYFYFWTTITAWLAGLTVLWAIFRFEDLRANLFYLLILAMGFLLPLIPYFILLQNRSTDVDSALSLGLTHQPDLWRIPELISYLGIVIFFCAKRINLINLHEPKFIFLFSLTLVAPLVFNQQVLTGYTLQPFHYQFFCANYIAVIPLVLIVFHLLQKKTIHNDFRKILFIVGAIAITIGYLDTSAGSNSTRDLNIWRDDLMPIAQKIKDISANEHKDLRKSPSVIMSFDLFNSSWANGIDLPSLTSQPVLWELHMTMFPDIGEKENLHRLYKFIYYQNFDEMKLKRELESKNLFLTYGFFGASKTSDIYTGEEDSVERKNIEKIVEQYKEFRHNFSYDNARTPEIAFVIVYKNIGNDLSAIDRWYERDDGEVLGNYILYRVKLRSR